MCKWNNCPIFPWCFEAFLFVEFAWLIAAPYLPSGLYRMRMFVFVFVLVTFVLLWKSASCAQWSINRAIKKTKPTNTKTKQKTKIIKKTWSVQCLIFGFYRERKKKKSKDEGHQNVHKNVFRACGWLDVCILFLSILSSFSSFIDPAFVSFLRADGSLPIQLAHSLHLLLIHCVIFSFRRSK